PLYRVISSLMTETISSTLNAMTAPLDDVVPNVEQARAEAGIVYPVLHADDQAAQDGRIDRLLKDRLALTGGGGADVRADAIALRVVQGHGRADVDDDVPDLAVVQRTISVGNGGQGIEPAVVIEHLEEVRDHLRRPSPEGFVDDSRLAILADG